MIQEFTAPFSKTCPFSSTAPKPSNRFRHHKWFAVGSSQQAVGLPIVQAGFRLFVEANGVAGAEGDIAQVTQTGALVPFLDVGVGPADIRPGRILDAIDEIAQMRSPIIAALRSVAL